MNVVLGIDPGATSAWAVLIVELVPRLILTDNMVMPKVGTKADTIANTPSAVVEGIMQAMKLAGNDIVMVALEDQYQGINANSTIKISRNAGRWEEACRSRGLPVQWIHPTTWQARELGSTRIARDEVKRRCIIKVKGLWGKFLNEHQSDAALIGRYVAIRLAFENARNIAEGSKK